MNNFIEFADLDGNVISITPDLIKGLVSQTKNMTDKEGNQIPEHCILLCGNYQFRVMGTYRKLKKYINEQIQFIETGI